MGDELKPGSWVGDSVEEFKKLPKGGKIAVGAGIVGVIGFALYERNKMKSATAVLPATGNTGVGIPPGATDTGGVGGVGGSVPPTNTQVDPPIKPHPIQPGPIIGGHIPTPTQPPPQPKLQYYTVQRGDNLSEIAAKLHLKGGWQALYNGNRGVIGSNPNLIYAGQRYNVTGL